MSEKETYEEMLHSSLSNSNEAEDSLKLLRIKENDSENVSDLDIDIFGENKVSQNDRDRITEQEPGPLFDHVKKNKIQPSTDLESKISENEMETNAIQEDKAISEILNGCENLRENSQIEFLKEIDINHRSVIPPLDSGNFVQEINGDFILDDKNIHDKIEMSGLSEFKNDIRNAEKIEEDINPEKIEIENIKISDSTHNVDSIEKSNILESGKKYVNSTGSENFVDILGNGLLTKRIILHGLGRETRPTHGDSVRIQYKGWNTEGELIDEDEVSFVLGDGDMIQAFDLGICLAERHEEFELKTDSRFAYGTYGWESKVKPDESLTYRIKLLQVDDPPDYTTFSYENRMKAADVKRERGNYLYRREEYPLAVNSYSRAIKIIETDPDYKKASTDNSKADMYDLFIKVTNNLAAAQLKLESYDNVIETCNTILNYDASNVKALFRKGKSLSMKGSYDEAIPILKRALELENSKLIAGEIQRCYQLKRAEDEQRARVCRKMFGVRAADNNLKSTSSRDVSGWKNTIYKYSPYIGGAIVTAFSIVLASIAIAKSKDN